MEHIDIDQMLEVPDTPDRHMIGRESVGQESNSSFSSGSEHTNFLHENPIRGLRGRGLFTENGHNRRSNICPPKSVKKLKIKDYEETNDVNPLGNPFASQNARSVQVSMDRSSSHGSRYSTGARNLDKGKTICTRVSSNPSPLQEGSKCFNLSKPKGHTQFPKMVCSHGFDVEVQNMNKREVASDGCSSVSCVPDSLQGKIQENGFNCASPALTHREGSIPADSFQHETREELSVPQSVSSHRGSRKRLVKNGLICPVNIERVKRSAEQHNSSSRDVGESQVGNQLNGSSCHLDISNIVAAENNSERVKDKNVLNHHSASKERLENLDHASSSGSGKGDGKTNVTGDASIDVYRCSEGLGDWRRTHNHSRNPDFHSPDIASSLCKGIDAVGSFAHRQQESGLGRSHSDFGDNCMNECDDARNQNAGQSAIRLGSELEFPYRPLCAEKTNAKRQKKQGLSSRNGERSTSTFVENVSQSAVRLGPELELPYGPLCAEKINAKRQKKQGLSSRNGECSTSTFVDPDVVFLGSSGESSMSRSSRVPIRLSQDISCPIYEVDELSPAVRSNVPQHLDPMTNNDLNAMARQVEADEVLARELQEQLYYEEPVVGGGEIDEHMARALQEVENGVLTSSRNQNQSNDRGLLASHLYRQPRSRSSQNSSSRRGSQGRVSNSTRMAQLRGRHHRQSPVLSRRARNLRFPADMALDMRIDILEALEAAVGNFSDGETDNLAFEVQHDFNENDYEMLLALDENNHQHAGASVHQINSLPQSTVQSDIHQETCAVCLETPTIGEIVRHLPCLHKFHKDCIDPWLSRKTSCPVCKSSIT